MRQIKRVTVLTALAACVGGAGAQWSTDPMNPLVIGGGPNEQVQAKVRPTADGGCWIAWFDNAAGGYDVRVQRLDRAGVAQLAAGGVLVADRGFSSTVDYDLEVDAAGFAYVTFNDDRSGDDQITVHRIAPDGTLLWGVGVQVSTGNGFHANPMVAPLASGGVTVGWTTEGTFSLLRLDESGAPSWPTPVTIVDAGRSLTLSDLHAEGDGVIALWVRSQTTSFLSAKGLRMQSFDGSGAALWAGEAVVYPSTAQGVTPVKSIQNGYFPTFLPDGAGGAVVAWYDNGTTRNAWMQHVNADGSLRFPGDGLAGSTSGTQLRLSAAGAFDASTGDYFLGFVVSNSTQTQWGYRAQRFDSTGTAQWGGAGVQLLGLSGVQTSFDRALASDGGVEFFTFEDCCGSTGPLYGWSLDAAGSQRWSPAPLLANSRNSVKARLAVAPGAAGNALLAWTDGSDVVAQAVNPDGTIGPPVCQADLSGASDPNDPAYGVPDGTLDAADFFYFLDQFVLGNLGAADMTGSSDPNDPSYGVPDGVLDGSDFFYFLDVFVQGCD